MLGLGSLAWRRICTCAIWITYFLALVGYLIIISDTVCPTLDMFVFGSRHPELHVDPSKGPGLRLPVLTVGIMVIAPLCFLSQKQLAFFSTLGTISNCLICAVVLYNFWLELGEGPQHSLRSAAQSAQSPVGGTVSGRRSAAAQSPVGGTTTGIVEQTRALDLRSPVPRIMTPPGAAPGSQEDEHNISSGYLQPRMGTSRSSLDASSKTTTHVLSGAEHDPLGIFSHTIHPAPLYPVRTTEHDPLRSTLFSPPSDFCLLSDFRTRGNIAYFCAILMAIVIQPVGPPMYGEMRDRSVGNFARALFLAFSFLFVLFSVFAVAGYLSFGEQTKSNVLNNLPPVWYAVMARLSMAVVCLGVYLRWSIFLSTNLWN